MIRRRDAALAVALAPSGLAGAASSTTTVRVEPRTDRRRISPLIYGVNWGNPAQLDALNAPLNRHGGNATSRYNWQINASNRGRDWYFESTPWPDPTPGEAADSFVRDSRAAGAEPMLTIPMLGWAARLGPDRGKLAGFSIDKYGAQADRDERWFADAGNG
ncbi:MAG: glycoside hydrolase family 44 protein, partial [Rhizobacter sp.]|nr:glycoside hydrolase family 44 protein [Rhizobacter sp.]